MGETASPGEGRGSSITVVFGRSRTNEGTDLAVLIRAHWPEADCKAVLDQSGAVSSYSVTVWFSDADEATEALFRLRDNLAEVGCPVDFFPPPRERS